MRIRSVLVLAMVVLLVGCNEELIKTPVARIRVHDTRAGAEHSITDRKVIKKICSFMNQSGSWSTTGVTPRIAFVTMTFFDSATNELVMVRDTGLDMWTGSLHRSLTEQEYRKLFKLLADGSKVSQK